MTFWKSSFLMSASHLPTASEMRSCTPRSSSGAFTPKILHRSASRSEGLNRSSHALKRSPPTSITLPSGNSYCVHYNHSMSASVVITPNTQAHPDEDLAAGSLVRTRARVFVHTKTSVTTVFSDLREWDLSVGTLIEVRFRRAAHLCTSGQWVVRVRAREHDRCIREDTMLLALLQNR